MELRIGINNRSKQFTGIGRDHLCDFQNCVQYQFPYPVRCGQLESTSCGFTEECSSGLVCLKPLHRAKYVILHHGQRKAGNLCREVYALTSAEVEQLLAVVICHLGSPAGSIRPVCLEEVKRDICGEQSVPLSLPASLREEQTHGSSCKLHIYRTIGAPERPVMLGEFLLLEFLDNLVGSQVAPLGMVFGLAKFNHSYQVALDMTAGDELDEVCTGKPTVNEQVVETDATLDGILHHLDGLVGLLHRVLLDTLLNIQTRIVGRETLAALLVRQSLFFVGLPSFLTMKREVKEQLAHSVAQQQRQALVAEDALMLDMGEHLADKLTLATALRSIRVIDNQADGLVMPCLCTAADFTYQLKIHRIQQLAPLNVTIIHKTIEHVFLTIEQAA